MKCSTCPFAVDYGTMGCPFFGYNVPEEFDSKNHEGCNLKFKEAKKKE